MILALVAGCAVTAAAALADSDSVVYRVSPESRFEVAVGKSGMLAFLGHEHLIRARVAAGRVLYRPGAPADSRVAIVVRADSLEVLTPPDTAERRQVTEVMRTQVLAVGDHPEITFTARELTPISGGFRVRGAFTLVGVTRDVVVDVAVTVGPDTLRATGNFAVKQTDFGIRPVRAGAGTVRVADRVAVEFAVVAVREPGG